MSNSRSVIRRIVHAATAGAGVIVLLAACGGTDSKSDHKAMIGTGTVSGVAASPSPVTSAPQGASFNDVDVMFAQMMIPHHQQAVEMANLAETLAKDPEVKSLAANIKAAQDPEIATMSAWLSAWGKPVAPEGGMEGHGMPGMMSDADMAELKAATGTEFDRMFLEMMIAHHNGAVQMARGEERGGVNPEAKRLAKSIEASQTAEIEQMQKIIDRL